MKFIHLNEIALKLKLNNYLDYI